MFDAEKPAPSLRARLTRALLAAVLAIAAVQAVVTYRTTSDDTEALFDAQMQRIALALSGGVAAGALPDDLAQGPGAAQDMIIQIWRADGLMLYRSRSALLLPLQPSPGFSNLSAGGQAYRVYTLQGAGQIVQVAQQTAARRQTARQLAGRAMLPVLLLAPLLMLIAWWVVGRALAPLARLRQQVAARRADDLAPLATPGLPAELRPLIDEMNALLARLAAAWDALGHFSADAAHELRTPLAALRLQAQSLQRAATPEARELAAARLTAGIDRATRLVEQLLALARQEGAVSGAALAPLDLSALARAAVADAEPEAARRGIAVALQADAGRTVRGQPEALAVLLRNLLENALRFAPEGGRVRVAVQAGAPGPAGKRAVTLSVEDSGHGIAPADRARVLDRFYRAPGAAGHGSGLGLAIVRAIAERHGAEIAIDASPTLGGARLALRFPPA